jgi:hypothetical protein
LYGLNGYLIKKPDYSNERWYVWEKILEL